MILILPMILTVHLMISSSRAFPSYFFLNFDILVNWLVVNNCGLDLGLPPFPLLESCPLLLGSWMSPHVMYSNTSYLHYLSYGCLGVQSHVYILLFFTVL